MGSAHDDALWYAQEKRRREIEGPPGFNFIEDAPHDGTFIRLRFRPSVWKSLDHEEVGKWSPDKTMKAGGWWVDREGYYITPGPLFWAPLTQDKRGNEK